MFEAGITLFIVGCVIRIWLTLSAHAQTKAMSPQPMLHRTCAIRLMRQKGRLASIESTAMIVVGAILILIYGLFN